MDVQQELSGVRFLQNPIFHLSIHSQPAHYWSQENKLVEKEATEKVLLI